MLRIRSIIRTGLLGITAMILTIAYPVATFADASSDCAPPTYSDGGVHKPVGADSGMYTYVCTGTYAGKWVSAYYVFDPDTYVVTPLYAPDYTYDCSGSQWYKTEWDFSAASNSYVKNRVVAGNPGLPTGCAVATPTGTGGSGASGSIDTTGPGSTNTTDSNGATAGNISTTGPGSTNTSTANGNNDTTINNGTNVAMHNTIDSVSASGNSLVLSNTGAGNATTGNSTDVANVVNLLQSSSNALGAGSNVITFTKNIDGDVYGDLILDPNMLGTLQPANTSSADNTSLTINTSTQAAINNNITVGANSGNATVASNTQAGDATTGNANAVANVVNMINSILSAGHSFIGTININGNLDGDILLPDNFVDQLVASNVPTVTVSVPTGMNNTTASDTSNTNVTNSNNLGINNQVSTAATSGSANVTANTSAGSGQTGNATTNVTAFNLTGSHVIGNNAVLVFVNVHGSWVGLIVNAPQGATAAELGGGVTQNTTSTANTAVNNTTNEQINNRINVAAHSGDATITNNTKAGNAKTGNSGASANLLNVENSFQTLSGWLGILFINVFGTWHGSFGVNTAAGNPRGGTSAAPAALPGAGGTGTQVIPVFKFVPHTSGSSSGGHGGSSSSTRYQAVPYESASTGGSSSNSQLGNQPERAVLASASTNSNPPSSQAPHNGLAKKLAIIGGGTVAYIAMDAFYSRRSDNKKAKKAAQAANLTHTTAAR
jgi:hypothetical protein